MEAPWRTEAARFVGAGRTHRFGVCGRVLGARRFKAHGQEIERRGARRRGDGLPRAAVVKARYDDDLRVLARHGVEVTSPGASDLITTQAAFEAFKGFDVTARTLNPIEGGEERVIEGRLQERTTTDVVINVKGRAW